MRNISLIKNEGTISILKVFKPSFQGLKPQKKPAGCFHPEKFAENKKYFKILTEESQKPCEVFYKFQNLLFSVN